MHGWSGSEKKGGDADGPQEENDANWASQTFLHGGEVNLTTGQYRT